MMRGVRGVGAVVIVCGLAVGCGDDSGATGSGGAAAQGGSSGEGATTAQGGSAGDGASTAEGGSSGEGGSNAQGGGSGVGGGSMQASFELRVVPSSTVTTDVNGGGTVRVACVALKDGAPIPLDAPATVTFDPPTGVVENAGEYSFASYGVHTITCDAQAEGEALSATIPLAVLNEAIDPLFAQIGAGSGGVEGAILALGAANGGPDADALAALDRLDTALLALADPELAKLGDALRALPAGGYPTTAELVAGGVPTSPDDALLSARLSALGAALDDVKGAHDAIGDAVTMADLAAIEAASAALEQAGNGVTSLQPSAHAYLASRVALADLVRTKYAPAVAAIGESTRRVIEAEIASPAAPTGDDGPTPYFGFVELSVGMLARNSLQMSLATKIYGPILADLDQSINNLILKELVDYALPPVQGGPVIEFLMASSSQAFAKVGYDWALEGSGFNADPSFNQVIIIGSGWQTIADSVISACGVGDAKTLPGKIAKVKECIDDVKDAVDESLDTPTGIQSGNIADQYVDFGLFPAACSSTLPTAIALIPVNLAVGRGPSLTVNCIK